MIIKIDGKRPKEAKDPNVWLSKRLAFGDPDFFWNNQVKYGCDFPILTDMGEVPFQGYVSEFFNDHCGVPTGVRIHMASKRHRKKGWVVAVCWVEDDRGNMEPRGVKTFITEAKFDKFADDLVQLIEEQGYRCATLVMVPGKEEERHKVASLIKEIKKRGASAVDEILDRLNHDQTKAGLPGYGDLPDVPDAAALEPRGVIHTGRSK